MSAAKKRARSMVEEIDEGIEAEGIEAVGVAEHEDVAATNKAVDKVALALEKKKRRAEAWNAKMTQMEVTALEAWGEFTACSRNTVVALWTAGKALNWVKSYKNSAGWKEWCEKSGVAISTANQAIRLFNWDRSGDKIQEYDKITDAKIAAGIVAKCSQKKAKPSDGESDDSSVGGVDMAEVYPVHLAACESIVQATAQIEEIVDELEKEELPAVASLLDAMIERLAEVRAKIKE